MTTASITGTTTEDMPQWGPRAGGYKTLVTIADTTLEDPFTVPMQQACIDLCTGSSSGAGSWNDEVRTLEPTSSVVRLNDTQYEITWTARQAYDLGTADEVVTVSAPNEVLVDEGADISAGSFTIFYTASVLWLNGQSNVLGQGMFSLGGAGTLSTTYAADYAGISTTLTGSGIDLTQTQKARISTNNGSWLPVESAGNNFYGPEVILSPYTVADYGDDTVYIVQSGASGTQLDFSTAGFNWSVLEWEAEGGESLLNIAADNLASRMNNILEPFTQLGYNNGSIEPSVGDIISGANGTGVGVVRNVTVTAGDFGDQDAEGIIFLASVTGTFFIGENYDNDTTSDLNFATNDNTIILGGEGFSKVRIAYSLWYQGEADAERNDKTYRYFANMVNVFQRVSERFNVDMTWWSNHPEARTGTNSGATNRSTNCRDIAMLTTLADEYWVNNINPVTGEVGKNHFNVNTDLLSALSDNGLHLDRDGWQDLVQSVYENSGQLEVLKASLPGQDFTVLWDEAAEPTFEPLPQLSLTVDPDLSYADGASLTGTAGGFIEFDDGDDGSDVGWHSINWSNNGLDYEFELELLGNDATGTTSSVIGNASVVPSKYNGQLIIPIYRNAKGYIASDWAISYWEAPRVAVTTIDTPAQWIRSHANITYDDKDIGTITSLTSFNNADTWTPTTFMTPSIVGFNHQTNGTLTADSLSTNIDANGPHTRFIDLRLWSSLTSLYTGSGDGMIYGTTDVLTGRHGSYFSVLPIRKIAFSSGSDEPTIGDILAQSTSTSIRGLLKSIQLDSGSWAGGDASGIFIIATGRGFSSISTFKNTTQDISNIASIDATTSLPVILEDFDLALAHRHTASQHLILPVRAPGVNITFGQGQRILLALTYSGSPSFTWNGYACDENGDAINFGTVVDDNTVQTTNFTSLGFIDGQLVSPLMETQEALSYGSEFSAADIQTVFDELRVTTVPIVAGPVPVFMNHYRNQGIA